jgi:phosphatidylserine synthase
MAMTRSTLRGHRHFVAMLLDSLDGRVPVTNTQSASSNTIHRDVISFGAAPLVVVFWRKMGKWGWLAASCLSPALRSLARASIPTFTSSTSASSGIEPAAAAWSRGSLDRDRPSRIALDHRDGP